MNTLVKSPARNLRASNWWHNPIDRFFRNDFNDFWDGDYPSTVPSINITEGKSDYKIEMAAPGLQKEDFNIDVEGNLMTISCEKESETNDGKENGNYSRKEYNYSSFSRSFTIPETADADRVTAKYTDGILNLSIPKKPEAQKNKSQKIKVQ